MDSIGLTIIREIRPAISGRIHPVLPAASYTDWCNPCTALSAIIDRVAKNYPNVTFGKVNIDEEEELAMGFEVRSIPFVVKIKNGKIVDSFVGLRPESFVEEFFAK